MKPLAFILLVGVTVSARAPVAPKESCTSCHKNYRPGYGRKPAP